MSDAHLVINEPWSALEREFIDVCEALCRKRVKPPRPTVLGQVATADVARNGRFTVVDVRLMTGGGGVGMVRLNPGDADDDRVATTIALCKAIRQAWGVDR